MNNNIYKVHNKDARYIAKTIKNQIVDVVITSPPYYDLKDYENPLQIGYGQDYQNYLNDLKTVFKQVYSCTKDNGTLWVIIDTFRKNDEVVLLPFDFANKIKEVGWKLQEIIIWGKDKTVPWVHKGQMKNLFEYILMFSKTQDYNFYIDEIRNYETLKKWWIKFPERYNPKGKTPDAIWHFNIPVQGSWGNGYIKHFCPLPEEMIERILKLTTKEGDVVLDPFSGSGAVLAKADIMNRKYIGFELNENYIDMFDKYLTKIKKTKNNVYETSKKYTIEQNQFETININLRGLKYARVLYKKLLAYGKSDAQKIFASQTSNKPKETNKLAHFEYLILSNDDTENNKSLESCINDLSHKSPLSNFSVQTTFKIVNSITDFIQQLPTDKIYTYTENNTHSYKNSITKPFTNLPTEVILSNIKVNIDDKQFEE